MEILKQYPVLDTDDVDAEADFRRRDGPRRERTRPMTRTIPHATNQGSHSQAWPSIPSGPVPAPLDDGAGGDR
jgi:hypothetical protein